MKVAGKFKQTLEIEYELSNPEILYCDNVPKITIDCKYNKKQLRAFKKGINATVKYLARMKRLGFTLVEQKGSENGT